MFLIWCYISLFNAKICHKSWKGFLNNPCSNSKKRQQYRGTLVIINEAVLDRSRRMKWQDDALSSSSLIDTLSAFFFFTGVSHSHPHLKLGCVRDDFPVYLLFWNDMRIWRFQFRRPSNVSAQRLDTRAARTGCLVYPYHLSQGQVSHLSVLCLWWTVDRTIVAS